MYDGVCVPLDKSHLLNFIAVVSPAADDPVPVDPLHHRVENLCQLLFVPVGQVLVDGSGREGMKDVLGQTTLVGKKVPSMAS